MAISGTNTVRARGKTRLRKTMNSRLKKLIRFGRARAAEKSIAYSDPENRRELRTRNRGASPRDISPVPTITIRTVEGSMGLGPNNT